MSLDKAFKLMSDLDAFTLETTNMNASELMNLLSRLIYLPGESVKDVLDKRYREIEKHRSQFPEDIETLFTGYGDLSRDMSMFRMCLGRMMKDDRLVQNQFDTRLAGENITHIYTSTSVRLRDLFKESQNSEFPQTETSASLAEQPSPATDGSNGLAPALSGPLGLEQAFELISEPEAFLQTLSQIETRALRWIIDRFLYSPPESVKDALEIRDRRMEEYFEQHTNDTETLISRFDALHTDTSRFVLCLQHMRNDDRMARDFARIKVVAGNFSAIGARIKTRLKALEIQRDKEVQKAQDSKVRKPDVIAPVLETIRNSEGITNAPAVLPADQVEGTQREKQSTGTQSLLDKVPPPSAKIPTPRTEVEPQPSPTAKEVNNQRNLVTDLT